MKRIGNLYERVISVENLRLADTKARRGKTASYGVRVHDKNREANILALHEALKNKTYRTSEYSVFTIHEPKERVIYRLPYYPDRIVHHALMNVLEPIWVRSLTHNTFSCVKGRGIEGCATYVSRIIKRYKGRPLYCLKIDIKKFYPSIDHEVEKRVIRRRLKDPDLLWLLDEIIDSAEGLPIGNYLSQFLANLLLSGLMHRLNERERVDCAEYADDIVVFADSKERLWEVLSVIRESFAELHLTLKDNWQVFPVADNRFDRRGRAVDYVGYKFYRRQRLMRKGIKQNFCRATARLNRADPPLELKAYKQAVAPWLGWAKHSNSKNLLHKIIKQQYYESILR
jgi:RNA-directed DNA polymerase